MNNTRESVRNRLRRELRLLSEDGVRICYPDDRDISPDRMATMIVRDTDATYMRDLVYDGEGKVVEVCFRRVRDTGARSGRKEYVNDRTSKTSKITKKSKKE